MKTSIAFTLILFLLVGCGQKDSKSAAGTNTTTESSPLTAPVDYLGALGKGKQMAEKTVDTASINSAIQMFKVEEDRYPETLEELVAKKYLPRLPDPPYGMKFTYDSKNGVIKVIPKPVTKP